MGGEQLQRCRLSVLGGKYLDEAAGGQVGPQVQSRLIDDAESGHCPTADDIGIVADPVADDTDRYGRLLRIVDVAGVDVGAQMIDEGLVEAWWPASAATPTRGLQYQATQAEAEADQRGSWGTCASIGR